MYRRGWGCLHARYSLSLVFLMNSAGVSMKLAVACAPVRRVQKNNEYNAKDYEV